MRPTARLGRRGAMEIQEIYVILVLFLLAVIIFAFFYIIAVHMKKQMNASELTATASAAGAEILLESYLRTPLNLSPGFYGKSALPGADMTMRDAVERLFDDDACLSWIGRDRKLYVVDAAAPGTLDQSCDVFVARTKAFTDAVCRDDHFILTFSRGATTVGFTNPEFIPRPKQNLKGSADGGSFTEDVKIVEDSVEEVRKVPESASVAEGLIHLPDDEGPITIRLRCVERYGVKAE